MSVCSLYDGSGSVWPRQPFPGNLFPGWSHQRRFQAQNAWNFFELVESTDAATRVKLVTNPTVSQAPPSVFPHTQSLWFPIGTNSRLQQYRTGQRLHQQACPGINWQSQRLLGPSLDVYPQPL